MYSAQVYRGGGGSLGSRNTIFVKYRNTSWKYAEYNIWSVLSQYCDSVYGAHVYRGGVFLGKVLRFKEFEEIF